MEKYIPNIDEDTSINLAKELRNISSNMQESVALKFDDNVSCSPLGMLLMENSIKTNRKENSNKDYLIKLNKEANSIKYAAHMGFFRAISENIGFGKLPGEANGSNNYVPITRISFTNYRKNMFFQYMNPLRYIEYESRNLARVLAQKNKQLEELFTYMIREIIRNSQEHGKIDEAWICAQNWQNKNYAEIAILDEGIGYKQSLKGKYGSLIENDEKAIQFALEPGITESYTNKYSQEDENSGFGLFVASQICDELNGSFTIISGDTAIKRHNGSVSIKKTYHKGSVISMSIDTSKIFDYTELLRTIVSKGENAIKYKQKASDLSKGKFIMY